MALRRLTTTLALAGVALLATATPALAHVELVSSNPAKDASLDAAPKQLQLTFDKPVSPEAITVDGPQGAQWTVGQLAVEGTVVTAPVQAAVGPAGLYAISYRVLGEDAHPITGTVAFRMSVATPPSPSAPPAQAAGSDDDGGVPAWVWIVGAVVIAALIGLGMLLARRSRGATPAEAKPHDTL